MVRPDVEEAVLPAQMKKPGLPVTPVHEANMEVSMVGDPADHNRSVVVGTVEAPDPVELRFRRAT
jgi:hypothetical protein